MTFCGIRMTGNILVAACAFLVLCAGVSGQDRPILAAEAAISMDLQTGEIIFTRKIDEKTFPASTTKILTALLLEENSQGADLLSYSSTAKATHPYSLDLPVGDTLTAAAGLDALLLYSANDVAVMIAETIAGSVPAFADSMNAKAGELGLANSHFTNPHGLHDQDLYTTAYDLSLLGRALLSYPRVLAAMGKREARIQSGSGLTFEFENRNKLVGVKGCFAGKTGYTDQAGRCLLAVYERNGRMIVGVAMQSEYDPQDTVVFKDMEALMEWSYSAEKSILYPAGEPLGQVNTDVKLIPGIGPNRELSVPLVLREEVRIYANDEEKNTELDIPPFDPWHLHGDTAVGQLAVRGRLSISRYALYPGISTLEILKTYKVFYILAVLGLLALSGTVVSFALLRRAKRRIEKA